MNEATPNDDHDTRAHGVMIAMSLSRNEQEQHAAIVEALDAARAAGELTATKNDVRLIRERAGIWIDTPAYGALHDAADAIAALQASPDASGAPASGCGGPGGVVDGGEKCSRCKVNPAEPAHTCPYAEEIHGDSEKTCDCCADCRRECLQEI